MLRTFTPLTAGLAVAACLFAANISPSLCAQVSGPPRPRITQNIDESRLTRLAGNTRPEVTPANDRGPVASDLVLEHMLLLLRRTPEQEQALQSLLARLHDPESPDFHQWLTAARFGELFGAAQQDVDILTLWLESHGFRINVVYPNHMLIDFSGTAGQVHGAFHTEIHELHARGAGHIANARDPQIPEALAPVVAGIVSLHDFKPRPMVKLRPQFTFSNGISGNVYAIVPGDLATIYNFNPVFHSGITGQGQTIVLIENTNLFTSDDWTTFRSTFGLSGYTSGSLSQTHPAPPSGPNNCTDPGVNSDDVEAILDAEYASAAAPSAAIQLASCADTSTTFGGLIAMQNLINQTTTPPPIISVSYGECEAVNGAVSNAAYNSTYQQAVAEGVSVYVAAGDSGAATCDQNQGAAASGISVSGFASTPYNVAVGGTDFGDTYANTNSTYWNSGNSADYASARSYVREIPWNDSCAGTLLASYEGYPTYGPNSLCNVAGGILAILLGVQTTTAGGGGPSGCYTGTPSTAGVVSGSCAGQPKPSWQSVAGNPNDGVRDLPDVSLFAANGLWGHYFVFCYSDTANGGTACTGNPSGWTGAGGTSFGSPIMAGVQALINQKTGARQGNPNPELYSLAASAYGPSGNASCNSSLGNSTSASCTFYDVTLGDMQVDCTGNNNCFDSADGLGVLSTSNTVYQPAYGTTTGWDFATGIGSINVANLVNSWPGTAPAPDFTLSASPSSITVTQGGSGSSTIVVTPANSFSGSVSLSASGLPSGVTASFATNPTTSTSLLTLTSSAAAATGTATITITGTSGSLAHSTSVTLTVNAGATPPDFSLSAFPTAVTIAQGTAGGSTVTVTPANGFSGNVTLSASGLPSGVTASFNPDPTTTTSALTLSASATAVTGNFTVTILGTSGSLTHTATVSLTVNPAPQPDFSLSSSPNTLNIARGSKATSTISITRLNGFSSSVTLSATGLPKGASASFSPNPATTTSTLTVKINRSAAVGTSIITINGTSGSRSHSTTITLSIH
jgi:subtilase family serine protease